jgi:hypothetical protein
VHEKGFHRFASLRAILRSAAAALFRAEQSYSRGIRKLACKGEVPMQDVYRNVLRHAATLAGEEQLARRLRVSLSVLASWMSGHSAIPPSIFLAAADYLAEVKPPEGAKPPGAGSR